MSKIAMYQRWLTVLSHLNDCTPHDANGLSEMRATLAGQAEPCQDDAPVELAFRAFLDSHPDERTALRRQLVLEALQHVDATLEHYKAIKVQRPLTDEEKQTGPVLIDLLSAARRLLHTK